MIYSMIWSNLPYRSKGANSRKLSPFIPLFPLYPQSRYTLSACKANPHTLRYGSASAAQFITVCDPVASVSKPVHPLLPLISVAASCVSLARIPGRSGIWAQTTSSFYSLPWEKNTQLPTSTDSLKNAIVNSPNVQHCCTTVILAWLSNGF